MAKHSTRGIAMALTLLALTAWSGAEAAEIKVLSTVGMQPATTELLAQFERETGHKIAVTYGIAAVLKTKFLEGAPADVLILTSLGIAEQVRAKYKDTGTKTGEALVAGEVDLGAAQIPELMAVPGVDVVGPLPAELQTVTIFSVGLATEAKEADAAKALIQFLAGPAAAPIYKAKGLEG
jgi:ABC-type molybdate transport system substrate-binding protein